jgi:uncharacterized protein with PhoU and TrkA domain
MFDRQEVEAFIKRLPVQDRATVVDYAVKLVGHSKFTAETIEWLSRSERISSAAIELSKLVLKNEGYPSEMSTSARATLADQFVTFASEFLRIDKPLNTEDLLAKVRAQAIELS